jgi:hypothetical protein
MALGSIVISLLMQTGSFETDAGRAAKTAEKRAKQIDDSFRKAGKAIGIALAGAATAVGLAVRNAINDMDEMSKAAQKSGMGTEEFSRLAYAASLADVSIEDLQAATGRLAKAQVAAQLTGSKQGEIFRSLGIAIKDASGNLRPATDMLYDFADAVQDQGASPEVLAAGMEIFGKSFQNLIPLLAGGSEGMRAAAAEADALGLTLSDQAGKNAEEFNDNLTRLKGSVTGAAMSIAEGLLPGLIGLTGGLVESSKETDTLRSFGQGLVTVFGFMGDVIDVVVRAVKALAVTAAATVTQLGLLYDIGKQVITLGFADGTVGEAVAGVERNREQLFAEYDKLINAPMFSAGMGVLKPGAPAAPTGPTAQSTAIADALQAMIDAQNAKTNGAAAGGAPKLTEEQKAAEQLTQTYESMVAQLRERSYLLENGGEAAKLAYELESGALKGLDEARAAELVQLDARVRAQEADAELKENGKRLTEDLMTAEERAAEAIAEATALRDAGAISQETYNRALEANKSPAAQLLEDLQAEYELIGLTNEQREKAIALRFANVDAASAEGQAIIAQLDAINAAAAKAEGIEFFKGELKGLFVDLTDGVGSMSDAFDSFFDNLKARVLQMLAERLIEQLFESFNMNGSSANGGGGGVANFIGALFGGGKAVGGRLDYGQAAVVGERGPELFVPNTAGSILPAGQTAHALGNMGRGGDTNITFVLPGRNDLRTEAQRQADLGRATQRQMGRSTA